MKYIFLITLFFLTACADNSVANYCKKEGWQTPDCEQYNRQSSFGKH